MTTAGEISFLKIEKCLCCHSHVKLFMDLGEQPLANNYHEKNVECEKYPLALMFCKSCFHSQLSHAVNPRMMFETYKYISGTSQTGLDFFKSNTEFVNNYKKKGKILDIACNDGTQLYFFKELGWETYGVDPAQNLHAMSIKNCDHVICDFWNDTVAKKLPIMDVITAQNVFAHTQYIDDFLNSCKIVMDDNTCLFIQTSQKNMIINAEFDTTYHEHISFFNTKSMKTLVEKNGLILNRVMEASIHGTSYIFEIKKIKDESIYNVNEHLESEEKCGLYSELNYYDFSRKTFTMIHDLKFQIQKHTLQNYKCIGFGAAAKGQTILCYADISLDYIIDENPLKIGLYSPKMNIPIVDIEHFKNDECEKYLVVILAWNFAREIKEKIHKNKGNKEIIIIESYFPNIVVS